MRDNRLTKLYDKLRGRKRLAHGRGGGRRYVVGTGDQVLIHVHPESADCQINNCVIHNPSAEALAIGPTHYNRKERRMERIDANGVARPDPDAQAWYERTHGKTAA